MCQASAACRHLLVVIVTGYSGAGSRRMLTGVSGPDSGDRSMDAYAAHRFSLRLRRGELCPLRGDASAGMRNRHEVRPR